MLIEQGKVHADENNHPISEESRYERAARLYRQVYKQVGLSNALCNLAILIEEGKVHVDENNHLIPEESRYEGAARLYREVGTPAALHNLAWLIEDGKVHADEKNQPIPEGNQNEVAARLYRQVYKQIGIADALCNIAVLIKKGKVHVDENNHPIPKGEHYDVAARLYREVGTPAALHNLAWLIEEGKVHADEKNQPIPKGEHYDVAARLYREVGTPAALHNLAVLIQEGKTHKDENNQPIPEGNQSEVAARLFERTGLPEAYYNLAISQLLESNALKDKKKALSYALLGAQQGAKYAMELYEFLKEELDSEDAVKEKSETLIFPSGGELLPFSTETKDSIEVSTKASKEPEFAEKISALLVEAKEEENFSLEARRNQKKLKKHQRSSGAPKKKAYIRQEKLRKLIKGELPKGERDGLLEVSSKTPNRKILFEWSKKAQEQLSDHTPGNRAKVFRLIKDLKEGTPGAHEEVLRYKGGKSRRINKEDRLVYREREGIIEIVSCKGHYMS
jgi:Txe/YoeB family toxin of Txe-Axe toxin-antitoxin module/TPR repeat protein